MRSFIKKLRKSPAAMAMLAFALIILIQIPFVNSASYDLTDDLIWGPPGETRKSALAKLEGRDETLLSFVNELKNAAASSTAPSSPSEGQFWFDTSTNEMKQYYASTWDTLWSFADTTTNVWEGLIDANSGTIDNLEASTLTVTSSFSVDGTFSVGNGTDGPGEIRVYEDADNGALYTSLISPSDVTNTSKQITLPDADGTLALVGLPMKLWMIDISPSDDANIFTVNAPADITISSITCFAIGGTATISVQNGASFTSTEVTDPGGQICPHGETIIDTTLTNQDILVDNVVSLDIQDEAGTVTRLFVEIR